MKLLLLSDGGGEPAIGGPCKGIPARRAAGTLPFGLSDQLVQVPSHGQEEVATVGDQSLRVASNDARITLQVQEGSLVAPRTLAGAQPLDGKIFERDVMGWVRAEAVDTTIAYVGELLRGRGADVSMEAITSVSLMRTGSLRFQ
jgi:hypothetical protein